MEPEEPLSSEDPEIRRQALADLARSEDVHRARTLMASLGDVDWRVRKEAARVAATVAEPWGLLPALVDALVQGDNVGQRNAALEVLERLGPSAASALLVALPRVPEGARKFLVAALGYAGGAGVDRLAELSSDADQNTAQAALEALARIGGRRAEAALRHHLVSDDPVQRVAALEGLESLEATVSLSELEELLDNRITRRLALRTLGFCEEAEAVTVLLDSLSGGSDATAIEATVALGRLLRRGGSPARALNERAAELDESTRFALRKVCASGREAARRSATWVLLIARDAPVLGTASELASEDRLAPAALDAIRAWGADAVIPLLAARRELDPRPQATALEMAAELAGDQASDHAVARLRSALREAMAADELPLVVAASAAMKRWAEAEDAALLVSAASRFDGAVAGGVGRSLEALAARSPAAVEAALTDITLDGSVGAGLVPAMAALGGTVASDRLRAVLNADDPRARRAATIALPSLGPRLAAELAGFALADEDVDVQVAAVRVLAQLDQGELGLDGLRLALQATFEPVVAAAARALGELGDAESAAPLRQLVSEGRPGVAVAAMEALGTMDDPALDDLLVEALGMSDDELVKEALRAIARRDRPRRAARIALALEHAAWDVRQLAATLLGETGSAESRDALKRRAEREGDRLVLASIERALRSLGENPG